MKSITVDDSLIKKILSIYYVLGQQEDKISQSQTNN